MTSNYVLYNIVPLGVILLLCYIFFDVVFDYFRKSKKNTLYRVLFYVSLFYTLSIIQLKWGGITLPIQNSNSIHASYIPTSDWYGIFDLIYNQISIGNSFEVMIFNIIIFIPFGILVSILTNISNIKKVSFVILINLSIAITHLFLEWGGLVMKSTNSMDIIYLIYNIIGGIIGIYIIKLTSKFIDVNNYLYKSKMNEL